MFCRKKSLSFLLLPFFFLLLSTFYLVSHGLSHVNHHHSIHSNLTEKGVDSSILRASRRSLLEGNNAKNSTLILAAKRTHRKDPLDDFKYYTGGWNIKEEHYISSVAFTAAPLFLIAAIWLVGFGVSSLFICLCFCCRRRWRYGYSKTAYAVSLVLLSIFTVSAVIGCVVLYTGQGKFDGSTGDTLDYVVKHSDTTVDNLRNVSEYLAAAKGVGVDQVFLPPNVQKNIDNVHTKIDSAATTLARETRRNKHDIQNVLNSVRLALIIIAAVMLSLALLGFLFSILGMEVLVYVLVIIGGILVAVTFILCGIFVALNNVMGDTCVAMDEWVQNPTAHTTLDDILPCVDTETAQETLSQSKDVSYQLVGVVNRIITNVSNANPPEGAGFGSIAYNQSGPLVPLLCNPFNPDKTDRVCAAGELDFTNATQVWKNYVCQVSKNNICTTVGRLTPDMYNQMSASVNVSYGLYRYGPFLTDLLDCTFVRDTFTGIHDNYCPDLRKYCRWIYIGLAMVSAGVMFSLIFWVLYSRERRHRKYTELADAAKSAEDKNQQEKP